MSSEPIAVQIIGLEQIPAGLAEAAVRPGPPGPPGEPGPGGEWGAETVSQAEAEAGTATTRRAWTAQRVFQAIAAWWASSAAAAKLAGIATGATANATDAQLRDRSTHTGTQAASTISDSTTAGRALLTAADAAAQRTLLGVSSGSGGIALGTIAGVPLPSVRYVRLQGFSTEALNSNTIDLTEIEVFVGGVKQSITIAVNFGFTSGSVASLVDGTKGSGNRCYSSSWSSQVATATITIDMGSPKVVDGIRIYSLFAQPRFPAAFDLATSPDNTIYTVRQRCSGYTFSDVGGAYFDSGLIAAGNVDEPDLTVNPGSTVLGHWRERLYAYLPDATAPKWKRLI